MEVLLVHPGGPFWRNKDAGAWTIPKGEVNPGEEPLATARREFQEETGVVPQGPFTPLGSIRQKGGKVVEAWAFQGDCDVAQIQTNTFTIEWPPRSGKQQSFPEVDKAAFYGITEAKEKMNPAQVAFLDRLQETLGGNSK
jgi:predicted NUDIX family NTP pyrophosphohydrolase